MGTPGARPPAENLQPPERMASDSAGLAVLAERAVLDGVGHVRVNAPGGTCLVVGCRGGGVIVIKFG